MLNHLSFFHREYALFQFVLYAVSMNSVSEHRYLDFEEHKLDLQREIVMVKQQLLFLIMYCLDLEENSLILPSEIIAGN